jgi:hypothetical protein
MTARFERDHETVMLGEISCDHARVECDDKETSFTLFFGGVIRRSSVITLTEGANVDAHDCRTDITSHRAASRREIMQVSSERTNCSMRCVGVDR